MDKDDCTIILGSGRTSGGGKKGARGDEEGAEDHWEQSEVVGVGHPIARRILGMEREGVWPR